MLFLLLKYSIVEDDLSRVGVESTSYALTHAVFYRHHSDRPPVNHSFFSVTISGTRHYRGEVAQK